MKVLVDTSVWIDLFRGATNSKTALLEELIQKREDICICGFIYTEIMQGIRNPQELSKTKKHFDSLIYLDCSKSTFELGATIYREVRKHGLTVRNSIDCLIAATVIENGVNLLENDRDYQSISEHFEINRIG